MQPDAEKPEVPKIGDSPLLNGPHSPERPAVADDLEIARSAIVDAGAVSAGLWLSYLSILVYLLTATGHVTHRDLLLNTTIDLPFLKIKLALTNFFLFGPILLLVIHVYILIHFVMLANKAAIFNKSLELRFVNLDLRDQYRRKLPINSFVQLIAGPQEIRWGFIGILLRLLSWTSLFIIPVILFIFFEFQFLPYHDVWFTGWHRTIATIDLVLLWALWPAIVHGEPIRSAWRRIGLGSGSTMACISILSVLLIFVVGTFPGEYAYRMFPWLPLRQLPTGPWSNCLVLDGLDLATPRGMVGSDGETRAGSQTMSLRARHLEFATLTGADLRNVDFTGANLQGAQLDRANLQGTQFENASLRTCLSDFNLRWHGLA